MHASRSWPALIGIEDTDRQDAKQIAPSRMLLK
jgi:hypothetical protein